MGPVEEGYQDLLANMARKPYPAIDRPAQRPTTDKGPELPNRDVNVEDLVDNRFNRKLDESGFIDRLYGTSGSR